MINLQRDLIKYTAYEMELAKLEVQEELYQKIRCITAFWSEDEEIAYITFYYNGNINESDTDIASDICAYIISHLIKGMLVEKYIRWDHPKPLPTQFLAYKREE